MSDEIFPELTEPSYQSQVEDDLPQVSVLVVDDVRISPSYMVFANAYEGKHYEEKLVIQNCGSRLAFIRLCEPNSKTFDFRAFAEGKHLSAGMKIVRVVKYAYARAMGVLRGFTTIWVNGREIRYHFLVKLSESILSVEPQLLDFGRIDAVNHATTRTFRITNSGYKGTQFAIDLGRNPLDMVVEPLKGVVAARSAVAVKVEVVGTKEGDFAEEFWIKTMPPLRMVVTGSFISPKLLVRKFINSLDFTLLEFPPTYYGATATQPLIIRNFSSSHSMFCVMAEIKGALMTLDEARKVDDNYRNFTIKPVDGRLAAQRMAVIQMTFAPVVTRSRKDKNYAACFLKIIRMDCRDVTPADKIFEGSSRNPYASTKGFDTESVHGSISKEGLHESKPSDASIVVEDEDPEEPFSFEHSIGVCVHGEKEYAGVVLRPTLMALEGLTLERVYERELLVVNNSAVLPIRVRYNKIAATDVRPGEFSLAPNEGLEVLVAVRAVTLTRERRRLTFDLLAEDYPKGGTLKKVGLADLVVSVEATEVVRKPRTKQCGVCNELALKLEPEMPHRLTREEMEKKLQHDEFWLAYIRSLGAKPMTVADEWQEYDSHRVAQYGGKCRNLSVKTKAAVAYCPFYPLPPKLLYNVKISPKSIRLRKVAAYTKITDFFVIENLNTFPIHVSLKSSKPLLAFDDDPSYVVAAHQRKNMYFSFSTSSTGRYYINIYILVNFSTLYEVTAVANVVPKTLRLDTEKLDFSDADRGYKFFKIINTLNACTAFDWEVPSPCFRIHPSEGEIKAEKVLLCMIRYVPDPSEPAVTECVLNSESGQKSVLTVSFQRREHAVAFDTYCLDFGAVPLNTPVRKKLTLKNLKVVPVLFAVVKDAGVRGVAVEPAEGVLGGLDSQVFTVSVLLKAVVEFATELVVRVDDEDIDVEVKGSVEYPNIVFKPDSLFFRKISPYSFDTLAFKVANVSNAPSWVTFPTGELPEFAVTDSENDQYKDLGRVVLQAGQAKVLFLHFHPNYVSTCALLLPYVINDLIGPVHISSGRSTSPQYFLREIHHSYADVRNVVVKRIPRTLSVVRINCSAIDKSLEFSKVTLDFAYFGEDHYSNLTSTTFEMRNVAADAVTVCIRIDDLQHPFSLMPDDEGSVERYEVSYRLELEPGETTVFVAQFLPFEMGVYEVKLPIFLRHYYDNKIFNYLTLRGVYECPTMVPSTQRCDFEPVPLDTVNETRLSLRMLNHFHGCSVTADCDLEELVTTFKTVVVSQGESVVHVTLSYESSSVVCFDTAVTFQCSCGSECAVEVTGVVEDCLLTTHAYGFLLRQRQGADETSGRFKSMDELVKYRRKLPNENTTCFPLFPADGDGSPYGEYMRDVQEALENWLFSQGFYMKGYYRIPEGFADFCKVREPTERKRFGGFKAPKLYDMPLMELVMNIAGKDVRKELAVSLPKDLDETSWFTYVTKTNANILAYLRRFPVFVPHVKSKYLLSYDQYVQYHKAKRPETRPAAEPTFRRLSKQCWTDLTLQIIKAFFLFRAIPAPPIPDRRLSLDHRYQFRQSFVSVTRVSYEEEPETFADSGVYGPREKALIAWLDDCFEEARAALWSPPPAERAVVLLDADLRDGLVLGAATARYCPYAAAELAGMYVHAATAEELLHNACALAKTWQTLRLSYAVSPLRLGAAGMVEALLVAAYLYDVLPHHRPAARVRIDAPLTQRAATEVELENLGHEAIHYRAVLFGEDGQLFALSHECVVVEPRERRAVKVTFHAKTVRTARATLLFSGETPGHKYGKSVAVDVVGVPDVSYACMKIPLTLNMYQVCEVDFHLQSPFKVEADYAVYFGYQHAYPDARNALFPWEEIRRIKTIKEFVLEHDVAHFDEHGLCEATHVLCCQHEGPKDMWFYFANPDVGDWGIQVTLTGRVTPSCYEHVPVVVPSGDHRTACRCKRRASVARNCPAILRLRLPMKNNVLWNARKVMLMQYVHGGDEHKFWAKRIYTPTGTRIMKLILNSETHPMRQVVEERVKYRVEVPRPRPFVTLKEVVVEDVTSEETFELPIHPVKDLLQVKKVVLKMVAEDGTETRYYELVFASAEEKVQKVTELE